MFVCIGHLERKKRRKQKKNAERLQPQRAVIALFEEEAWGLFRGGAGGSKKKASQRACEYFGRLG